MHKVAKSNQVLWGLDFIKFWEPSLRKKKNEITNTKLGVNVNIYLYWEKKSQQIWTIVVQGFFF